MTHHKKVRELQQNIVNVSTDIQVISEAEDYEIESDMLEVRFCTNTLNKKEFVNEIFAILHQVNLEIICGMQLDYINYSKDTNEFSANIVFIF